MQDIKESLEKPKSDGKGNEMDLKKMDLDSLDELIARCEDSMCRPFRKKPAPEAEGVAVEHEEEEGDDKPDLSEMDMEDLLRMYEEMKAKE